MVKRGPFGGKKTKGLSPRKQNISGGNQRFAVPPVAGSVVLAGSAVCFFVLFLITLTNFNIITIIYLKMSPYICGKIISMYQIYCRFSDRSGYMLPSVYLDLDDAKSYCNRQVARRGLVFDNLFGPEEPYMNYEIYNSGSHLIDVSLIESNALEPVFKSPNCCKYVYHS